MIVNLGSIGSVIAIGIIFLILFIILRFFKAIFSLSFIGFILSLVSYFIYDFIFATVPVVAAVSLVCSLTGFSKNSLLGKIFALFGILISGYIILTNYGII